MRIVRWGLAILLVLPAGIAAAQQDQQPQTLAEAARLAREQKKDQPKATHYWDNDTVPKTPNEVSVVGQASAATATGEEKDANSPAAGAPASDAGAAKGSSDSAAQSELNDAKERLKNLTADLDLVTRQNDLDRRTYYGKPDYSSDTDGADKLKREETEIEAKKQEVAEAQKKVDELQAKLGPPPEAAPRTQPN